MSIDEKKMQEMVESINRSQFQGNQDQYSYNFDKDKNYDPADPVPTKIETEGHLNFVRKMTNLIHYLLYQYIQVIK